MRFNAFPVDLRLLTVFILSLATLCGCAGPGVPAAKVQPGDEVMVDYTCRLPGGALLITTDAKKAGLSDAGVKAKVFMPLKEYGPVSVTAGDEALNNILGRHVAEFLDLAVPAYIADAVVGAPYGKTMGLTLQGRIPPKIAHDERFTRIKRTQKLPWRFVMKHAAASREFDKEIVSGDTFDYDVMPGARIRFEAVKDPMVTAVLLFEEGHEIPAPWGRKRLTRIDEKYYLATTMIEVDDLGRAGGLIGRIEAVEEDHFRIDWGHPFGGRTLSCETFVHPLPSKK